jgi:hypothetical protein
MMMADPEQTPLSPRRAMAAWLVMAGVLWALLLAGYAVIVH